MKTGGDDVANSIKKTTLNGDSTRSHGKEPCRSISNDVVFLTKAIQEIIRHANPATSEALSVEFLIGDGNFSAIPSIADICLLHEQSNELANITSVFEKTVLLLNEVNELSIIKQLEALRYCNSGVILKYPLIEKLMLHFETKIREIIREIFKTASDQDLLWRIAEECYKQATRSSGSLHIDDYFNSLQEAYLESQHDPGFASEEHYEHENRLPTDKKYAVSFGKQADRKSEDYLRKSQSWLYFWIRVLNNAPNGPTLFYLQRDSDIEPLNMEVPSYLFRTFDSKSQGINDESVIASIASESQSPDNRVDILKLEKQRATKMLGDHLSNAIYSGKKDDNLVSWTSSLPFAIQYAIFRGTDPSDINICAVDTRKFPKGQFMRDLSLLNRYDATAKTLNYKTMGIFGFRPTADEYYNGEYLSQGSVNLSNRSCVVSLENLTQAGLYGLYPEFDEPEGKQKWTERVRELRHRWSAEQHTTEQEIRIAFEIARDCFSQFEPLDLASILLAFKNRRCSRPTSTQPPSWADKPEEVRRYWTASEAIEPSVADLDGLTNNHSRRQGILREVFD